MQFLSGFDLIIFHHLSAKFFLIRVKLSSQAKPKAIKVLSEQKINLTARLFHSLKAKDTKDRHSLISVQLLLAHQPFGKATLSLDTAAFGKCTLYNNSLGIVKAKFTIFFTHPQMKSLLSLKPTVNKLSNLFINHSLSA